jgi:hypothetical protein
MGTGQDYYFEHYVPGSHPNKSLNIHILYSIDILLWLHCKFRAVIQDLLIWQQKAVQNDYICLIWPQKKSHQFKLSLRNNCTSNSELR